MTSATRVKTYRVDPNEHRHAYGRGGWCECGERRQSHSRPDYYWVFQTDTPAEPEWTDGTDGEWFRHFTVRGMCESSEYGESAREILGYLRRDRVVRNADGDVVQRGREDDRAERRSNGRAPLGERDREFTNVDLRVVQFQADEWDWTLGRDQRRVTEFHDLLAWMDEIPVETAPSVKWNRERTESGFWEPAKWTLAGLAERLCKFRWNEHFWTHNPDGSKRENPVPEHAWAGVVHDDLGLVYLGDSVYSAVIAKWKRKPDAEWVYTVFWRERVGRETGTNGRSYWTWVYHYSKTFTSLDGPSYLDRQGALAFASRLTAKAKLEAELLIDLKESMGEYVDRGWDRDEYPYDPVVFGSTFDHTEFDGD